MYLNGEMVSQSRGEMVTNLTIDDFCIAKSVKSNPQKTVIERNDEDNKSLDKHIEGLRKEKEDNPDDDTKSRRLAALTNGMVTVKVGADTDIEKTESLFRYEDAINATRSAIREGILRGGGMAIWTAWNMIEEKIGKDFRHSFGRVSTSPVEQILDNSDEAKKNIMDKLKEETSPESHGGYNAKTRELSDLIEDGVVDPVKVTKQAISNSISVVKQIITSNYLVLQKNDKEQQRNKKGEGEED
jgi:chaperonin GroEL